VFFNQPVQINDYLASIQNDFLKIPDIIEDVTIVKPHGDITRSKKLEFSSDPLIACRELYGKLKQSSEADSQILVFEKQHYMVGEVWDAFLERITKASSLQYSVRP
jgi:L-threonylcarbamoyladenylate synthase